MKKADLVLEGGGVLGVAHVGAVSVFDRAGYEFHRLGGSSAGAIVAALLAAGMSVADLESNMRGLKYRRFLDRGLLRRIPFFGPLSAFLFHRGVCRGRYFREWFGGLLAGLGVETFGQLRIEDDERSSPEQRYRLMVVAADLTRGELVRLPWDYERYGLNPDEQLIVDAVAASTALPFLYEPVRLAYPRGESLLVDGGVLSNFPIDAFDRRDGGPPGWPTFGVKLIPPLPTANARLFPFTRVLGILPGARHVERLLTTLVVGRDQAYLRQPWVKVRTIQVDTDAVNPFDFGIEEGKQGLLYSHGRLAAESFLETWDWQRYLREFRT